MTDCSIRLQEFSLPFPPNGLPLQIFPSFPSPFPFSIFFFFFKYFHPYSFSYSTELPFFSFLELLLSLQSNGLPNHPSLSLFSVSYCDKILPFLKIIPPARFFLVLLLLQVRDKNPLPPKLSSLITFVLQPDQIFLFLQTFPLFSNSIFSSSEVFSSHSYLFSFSFSKYLVDQI